MNPMPLAYTAATVAIYNNQLPNEYFLLEDFYKKIFTENEWILFVKEMTPFDQFIDTIPPVYTSFSGAQFNEKSEKTWKNKVYKYISCLSKSKSCFKIDRLKSIGVTSAFRYKIMSKHLSTLNKL